MNKRLVVLAKFYKGELNPFDGAALECALEMGFKDVTLLTMSPPSNLAAIKTITRLGVEAVVISDTAYAGSDTIATSLVLSKALKKLSPDIIFCGRQSIDGDTAQVPPMVAERLGFTLIRGGIKVDNDRVFLRNGKEFVLQDKTIITFERCKTLRFPSIFSKERELTVWDNSVLEIPKDECGLIGSPTRVINTYESSVGRRSCSFVDKSQLLKIIKDSLSRSHAERDIIVREKLETVWYVGNIEKVAQKIGEKVFKLDIDGLTFEDCALKIKENSPNAVLWEDSEVGKEYASRVAVILGVGVCADCISFDVKDGRLVMTRPAQGGNITADIVCTGSLAFATVRTARQDCADVVFSVGNGAIDYIDKIKELAKSLDADLTCSRTVVDGGKMEYSRQVGLTGKTVSPKVYVALGISGAVQHTCAIDGAGTVIAVNNDKNARIFDYADYGVVDDINNLRF